MLALPHPHHILLIPHLHTNPATPQPPRKHPLNLLLHPPLPPLLRHTPSPRILLLRPPPPPLRNPPEPLQLLLLRPARIPRARLVQVGYTLSRQLLVDFDLAPAPAAGGGGEHGADVQHPGDGLALLAHGEEVGDGGVVALEGGRGREPGVVLRVQLFGESPVGVDLGRAEAEFPPQGSSGRGEVEGVGGVAGHGVGFPLGYVGVPVWRRGGKLLALT